MGISELSYHMHGGRHNRCHTFPAGIRLLLMVSQSPALVSDRRLCHCCTSDIVWFVCIDIRCVCFGMLNPTKPLGDLSFTAVFNFFVVFTCSFLQCAHDTSCAVCPSITVAYCVKMAELIIRPSILECKGHEYFSQETMER